MFFFLNCIKKPLPNSGSLRFSPLFSSRSIIVLMLIFRSMTHSQLLLFVYDIRVSFFFALFIAKIPFPYFQDFDYVELMTGQTTSMDD